jgi:hypothetical protein
MTLQEEFEHFLTTYQKKFLKVNKRAAEVEDIFRQMCRMIGSRVDKMEARLNALVERVEGEHGNKDAVEQINARLEQTEKKLSHIKILQRTGAVPKPAEPPLEV